MVVQPPHRSLSPSTDVSRRGGKHHREHVIAVHCQKSSLAIVRWGCPCAAAPEGHVHDVTVAKADYKRSAADGHDEASQG